MNDEAPTDRVVSHLMAVPNVARPDTSTCGLFERGHHAHPVQVSMALKRVGDDGRYRRFDLVSADVIGEPGWEFLSLTLVDDDGEELYLLQHDPGLASTLALVEEPVFVWEEEFGVLFVMTEQGREVLGTGSITAVEGGLSACDGGSGS